jgi:hypothetical protein
MVILAVSWEYVEKTIYETSARFAKLAGKGNSLLKLHPGLHTLLLS